MDIDDYFASSFRTLTKDDLQNGYEPLLWQRRLFERFCLNDIPKICDLPTGLGKTSVIHIWFLALRHQLLARTSPRLPRRLVYVVDRRTVSQARPADRDPGWQQRPALHNGEPARCRTSGGRRGRPYVLTGG